MDLPDSVALVTGAGRGIGAAIATELAGRGHAVALCDIDVDAAETVAAALADKYSVRTAAVRVDISDDDSVTSAVAQVNGLLGPVDVLVNNAAIDVVEKFVDNAPTTWDRIISVNLRGTIAMTRAVLDPMIERERGRIVHIASDAGKVGSSGEVVYSATKGGIIAFGKALAREVAKHGITVNSVCPGPTDTALLGQVADYSSRMYDAVVRSIPLRRVAQPADIAGVVGFLVSAAGGYLTGQAISVSGGITMA